MIIQYNQNKSWQGQTILCKNLQAFCLTSHWFPLIHQELTFFAFIEWKHLSRQIFKINTAIYQDMENACFFFKKQEHVMKYPSTKTKTNLYLDWTIIRLRNGFRLYMSLQSASEKVVQKALKGWTISPAGVITKLINCTNTTSVVYGLQNLC